MKVSEILSNARDIVEAGWCQGRAQDNLGNYCAVGALSKAEQRSNLSDSEIQQIIFSGTPLSELHKHLKEFGPYGYVPEFNDAASTTKQDVLALFDKAIASAEEAGR